MKVWRSSSKDRVGLLIISVMLSICIAVVVLLMRSYNSGTDKKSKQKRREKAEKSVLKMLKKKSEGGRAQTYKDKIKITKLDNVNEHRGHGDIGYSSKHRYLDN